MSKDLLNVLRSSTVFQNLRDSDLERLLSLAETRQYQPNEILFVEMSKGDEVFLVVEGTLSVQLALSPTEPDHGVISLGPGEIVGEISLVEEGFRSATVTAQTRVTVLTWSCSALREECQRNSEFGYALILGVAKVLARRIRRWNVHLLESALWGMS